MPKKKIVFCSNALWNKTGLSRNLRNILIHLYKTGKYEIVHYAQGVLDNHPNLGLYPWKTVGCIPADNNLIQTLNKDQVAAKHAAYGSYKIDEVIEQEKPDILWLSDDIWAFPASNFLDKPYVNKEFLEPEKGKGCYVIHHLTADSLPLLDELKDIAKRSRTYVWASFAEEELKKESGYDHVGTIGGAIDGSLYHFVDQSLRKDLRKRMGIKEDSKIFFYLGRNQLRKQYNILLEAFAKFKKTYPAIDVKLLFHCSWSEGWPLKRLMDFFGIKEEDVLTTYVCEKCNKWHVMPFKGEKLDCPFCGAKKSFSTSSVAHGVPEEEMYMIYGLADASFSLHTSGGFEYHQPQSLLCGLPLATVPYSSGKEFAEQKFVRALEYNHFGEINTGFIKAVPTIESVEKFMRDICNYSAQKLESLGKEGREWAKQFDGRFISQKWEEVFDSIPHANWDGVCFEYVEKDPNYTPSDNPDNKAWIKELYKNILKIEVSDNDSGLDHWLKAIENGTQRSDITAYFKKVAIQENSKNQKIKLESFLDDTGRKRVLIVCPRSAGDILLSTSLLESCSNVYPDHDIYYCCEPVFAPILNGNKFIHKVLPYHPYFDNELLMIGAGTDKRFFDVYVNLPIFAQKHLNYLSNNKPLLPCTL